MIRRVTPPSYVQKPYPHPGDKALPDRGLHTAAHRLEGRGGALRTTFYRPHHVLAYPFLPASSSSSVFLFFPSAAFLLAARSSA